MATGTRGTGEEARGWAGRKEVEGTEGTEGRAWRRGNMYLMGGMGLMD